MQPPQPPSPQQPQQPQFQYPGQPPLAPRSHLVRNVVIVVVVIAVVAGLVVVAEYRSSALVVTVSSNHISNTITYIVTVDGRQVDSGLLNPGEGVQITVPLTWWADNCESHLVVATSTGGGFGSET